MRAKYEGMVLDQDREDSRRKLDRSVAQGPVQSLQKPIRAHLPLVHQVSLALQTHIWSPLVGPLSPPIAALFFAHLCICVSACASFCVCACVCVSVFLSVRVLCMCLSPLTVCVCFACATCELETHLMQKISIVSFLLWRGFQPQLKMLLRMVISH